VVQLQTDLKPDKLLHGRFLGSVAVLAYALVFSKGSLRLQGNVRCNVNPVKSYVPHIHEPDIRSMLLIRIGQYLHELETE
jgi:hypothetical protein